MSLPLLGVSKASGGGGSWTNVFTITATSPGNDSGWNGYTIVGVIPLAAFSATGGTQIRLTLNGPFSGTENSVLSAFYIGNGGGGETFDFGSTPVQILKSGSGTLTVPQGGQIVTDAASFVKDGTNPFVFAAQLQDGTNDNLWKPGAVNPGGYSTWYKNAIDAATQDKTGYSDNSAASWSVLINNIELLI